MSITRKALRGMQLTDEQVESIIEMHTETTNGLRTTIDSLQAQADSYKEAAEKYKADAEKLPSVQDELNKLKEATKTNPFETKYNDLKKEYDDFKANTDAKEHKAAVDTAVKSYFSSKHIKGDNLNIALMAAQDTISGVELEDGKIKDTAALDALVEGTLSGLVTKTVTKGANVPTPPTSTGGKETKTKEEILSIKNTAERQKAIAENPELFGIS